MNQLRGLRNLALSFSFDELKNIPELTYPFLLVKKDQRKLFFGVKLSAQRFPYPPPTPSGDCLIVVLAAIISDASVLDQSNKSAGET